MGSEGGVCVFRRGKEVCGTITRRVNPTELSVDTQTWEALNENFKKPPEVPARATHKEGHARCMMRLRRRIASGGIYANIHTHTHASQKEKKNASRTR